MWVVRRTRIKVERFPQFGEELELATFCSGMGRMWAERRTTVTRVGAGRSDVEAVALWVHLDPADWRPGPLLEEELECYGSAAAGRKVTARLRHPAPEAIERDSMWLFRATELDIAGHVNNAAYWQPLEEELLDGPEPESLDVGDRVPHALPARGQARGARRPAPLDPRARSSSARLDAGRR